MARENQTREIDGWTWEVGYLPPKPALKVLTRLSKILGQPIGMAGDALMGAGAAKPVGAEVEEGGEAKATSLLDRALPDGLLAKVIGALTDKLDEAIVIDTVELLLTVVQVKGPDDAGTRRLVPLRDFDGETVRMLKVAAFALEVNFGDFLGGGGVSGAILAKVKAAAGPLTSAK